MSSPSIFDALDAPTLFQPFFAGPSWALWRAVLKAALAEPMTETELELFRSVAERDPPNKRVKEVWIVAGRRAGKDSIASLLGAYSAGFIDYESFLRPGERATVMCLASDRDQARIVLGYTRAYFDRIELLHDLVERETVNGLELGTGAEIVITTSSFRAVRGRTIALAVLDECAFWRSEESSNPAEEVYAALRPGLATLPGSMLIGISSPHKRSGLLYDKFKASYGQPDERVLVVRGASKTFNPTIADEEVEDALARDPAKARAEWLAEWRDDIASYLPRELIEASVDHGVLVRPRETGKHYSAFVDAASGVGEDSYCLGIAHREANDRVVLDCLREIRPRFDPASATAELADIVKSYGLAKVTGDRYALNWVAEAWGRSGITYENTERDRSAIYGEALPLFTSGRARLLDNPRVVAQIANLERKTTATGRDIIGHPERAGHHDDAANAVCGAMVLASARPQPLVITDELMAWARGGPGLSSPGSRSWLPDRFIPHA
jgi:hypothetical protein